MTIETRFIPLAARFVPAVPARRRAAARALAAALAAGALAGCMSLAPEYERPALPVPDRYDAAGASSASAPATAAPASSAASGSSAVSDSSAASAPAAASAVPASSAAPADLPDWRAYFADAQLRTLIATALDHNRDLRIALLRVEEARAAYGVQRADQFPNLNLQALGLRASSPAGLNLTGTSVLTAYSVGVGISSWELDFWGRVRSLKDAALETYLASDAARQATTLMLISQVANTYLAQCELEDRLALARKTIASRQESYRIFKRRVEVGSTSRLDLTQVETLLTQAEALGAQLEQARAANAHALALLVGAPVAVPAPAEVIEQGAFAELRPGLPSDLLARRPDIVAAEHKLKAAHANIGAARAAFFPRVTLTASYGSASTELGGLFDSGSSSWSVVPILALPIFDAGRLRANLDVNEVRRDQAVAEYEKTIQGAFRDVLDALSARTWLARQVEVQQQALRAQAERARLAQLRYDNGATTYLDVLDAQRELLNVEQALVQVRRQYLSSNVSLYAALGGGPQADATSAQRTHETE